MKRITRYSLGLLLVSCVLVAVGCVTAGPKIEAPAFQVGTASATVNPPLGVCMAGYDLNRRATGIHDDLYAKAVVFYDGTSAVALVVVDSISLQYDTVNAIREAASKAVKRVPLPPERIIVQATHSHCAPDTIGIYGPDQTHTGRDPAYMQTLVGKAAEQVVRAVETLQPARVVYAQTECKGWAVNDSDPGALDNSVTILQCLDSRGVSIATLTNFACHPTVLDGDTTQISADWVASFYKTMAGIPGEHLFLQAAIGCWIQPVTPERTFALAQKYGTDLGQRVLAALRSPRPLEGTQIRFANKVIQLEVENEAFHMMSKLGLVSRELSGKVPTEVAWFSIGSAQFATHFGETAPMYAAKTKALMKSGPKFVLGLGLDHLGYICPPEYFEKTGAIPHAKYLISMSPGPKAGPTMMDALQSIIP